jgi:hypothetical protein
VKLHSPAFSRAIRARLRAERHASPALRRALRRWWLRRAVPAEIRYVLLRVALLLVPVIVLLSVYAGACPSAARSGVVAAWFLCVMLLGAFSVRARALDLPPALLNLPIAPEELASLSRRRVRSILWRPCLDALVLFSLLAGFEAQAPWTWLAVVPLAALCGAAVWSVSVWLALLPPQHALARSAGLLPFILLAALWVPGSRAWLFDFLVRQAETLTLLSPGGWLAAALMAGTGALPPAWALGLAPALLLAATGARAVRVLIARLAPERALLALLDVKSEREFEADDEGADFVPTSGEPPGLAADLADEWRRSPLDRTADGWIERLFLRRLSGRERLVLDCVAARTPAWTRLMRSGTLFLAAGVALAWLRAWAPLFLASGLAWAEGIALGVGLLLGLPLASGFDQLAGGARVFGVQLARVALYPLRLRELARLTFKAALLRGAVLAPVLVAVGAALSGPWGFPVASLAAGGAKLVFLSVAFSPCLCVFALSGVSNDTRTRPGRGGCLVILLLVGGLLALLALAAATLFAHGVWSVVAALVFAALAWGMASLYLRLYERGGFDLVSAARE